MRFLSRASIATATVLAITLAGTPVLALGDAGSNIDTSTGETTKTQPTTTEQHTTTTTENERNVQAAAKTAAEHARLEATKLRVCQTHERVIDDIMSRIGDRGQRQLNLFATIAERVEAFYTNKKLSASNYDTLVAAVNTKKSAAQAAVNLVKSDQAGFKCDGTDPKGVAQTFKADLNSEQTALKAYRQAVKDLITGIKSAKPTTSSATTGDQQ